MSVGARARVRRWGLRLLGAALSIVILLLALQQAAPPLLRRHGERLLSGQLGRAVTIGAVELDPWRLRLMVRDLRVAGADGGAGRDGPLLVLSGVRAEVDALRSLWHRAPVIAALRIDAPKLSIARIAPGRYDFDDVLQRLLHTDPQAAAGEAPARFALANIELRGGAIDVDDRPLGRRHAVRELSMAMPFISTLPADAQVRVQPHLAFTSGGMRFDTRASSLPFAPDRDTTLALDVRDIDLASVAPYLPAAVPLVPAAGRLDARLQVRFAQPAAGPPALAISGEAAVRDLALGARAGEPRVRWQRLQVGLADVQPLQRRIALGDVRLDGLQIDLRRQVDGRLELQALLGAGDGSAPDPQAAGAGAGAGAGASPAWAVSLRSLAIEGASVAWRDEAQQPAAALALTGLSVNTGALALPLAQTLAADAAAVLRGADASSGGRMRLQLRKDGERWQVDGELQALPLAIVDAYLQPFIVPHVTGELGLAATLAWTGADVRHASVRVPRLQITSLALGKDARIAQLELSEITASLATSRAEVARLAVRRPMLVAERGADGALSVARWMRQGKPDADGRPAAGESGWRVAVRRADVDGGELTWRDHAPPHPVSGSTARLPVQVQARELALNAADITWPPTQPLSMRLRTRIADGHAVDDRHLPVATVDVSGRLGLSPLQLDARVQLDRVPLHVADSYVDPQLGLSLQRALAGGAGTVSLRQLPGGMQAGFEGEARLADVHVYGLSPGTRNLQAEELLGWQLLGLRGLRVALRPGEPPSVEVADAAIEELQAQLVVTEEGKFNLRDAADARGPAAASAAPAAPAAPGQNEPPPLRLRMGGLRVADARIDYQDRYVKPNYRAALTNLQGRVGSFDSADPRQLAAIELQGNVAGTGRIEVRGNLNPLARPLALDIAAKATEIELAPLSPYSGKYAGYGIERGKLSMDVHYNIQPDGRLDAKNRVVLNQLTFGEKVDSPDATTLPVRLALALLKDRHGVIDVDLPVQGSINDPQFSMGGLILKVIVNLIGKAITAPFSLFAGGGDELRDVGFTPGTALPSAAGIGVLDKVAQAMADRPGVRMTVAGAVDPSSEADAIRDSRLQRDVAQYLRRERLQSGDTGPAGQVVDAADRERALRALYRESALPGRPANYVELARTLPLAQIEQQLRAAQRIGEDDARELALQRGIAVRDALVARGIASERLFVAAPVLSSGTQEEANGSPHVRLTLSAD